MIATASAVAACSTSSGSGGAAGGTTIGGPISLAEVQAEVASIKQAVDHANSLLQQSTSSWATTFVKTAAQSAVNAFDAAADHVAALTPTEVANAIANVESVIAALLKVLSLIEPILSLNPVTATALSLALSILQAFAGNLSMPVVIPPKSAAVGATLSVAPYPVPLPSRSE